MFLSTEEPFGGLLSRQIEVTGHIAQDGGQGSDPQRPMPWDGDVMLTVFDGGSSGGGCLFDGSADSRTGRGPSRGRHRRRLAEASSPDDFLAHEVDTDDRRDAALIEVAANRIAHFLMEMLQVVGLRKDRLAQRAR
jgi:hypothetical protein